MAERGADIARAADGHAADAGCMAQEVKLNCVSNYCADGAMMLVTQLNISLRHHEVDFHGLLNMAKYIIESNELKSHRSVLVNRINLF